MARRILRATHPGCEADILQATRHEKNLNYDELRTVMLETEAALNSRPLTYMEADVSEAQVIRPIDTSSTKEQLKRSRSTATSATYGTRIRSTTTMQLVRIRLSRPEGKPWQP
ncbi:hypothetical protein L596_000970 [Steinernema carpocapsae]|uniref:Uncharacterized protein n=1 Tax=Steinernema carpocapsae TaxID=34508 RepID=A0A4V6I794_STECR|nr:hypothetical protein L596_000970 [Steinernema carpocapsae]